ncbi:hypothetical protein ACFXKD_03000 [Nocardiopsis aegyptia]|uniref:hypothetical protein n=1 Tax=Nocardiopsis aegyptia TaxID=220378 RepID=UPI00366E504C
MASSARDRADLLDLILYEPGVTDGIGGAVRRARTALDEWPDGDPWPHYVLAMALGGLFQESGDQADLESAREHLAEAIRLGGREDPDAALFRQQYAALETGRWAAANAANPAADPDELRGALRMAREALDMTEPDSPHLSMRLAQVAELLVQVEGPDRLAESLRLAERALEDAHPDDPRMSRYQQTHATLLQARAEHENDRALADHAEVSAVRAGHLAPAYDPMQARIIGTLQRARAFRSG